MITILVVAAMAASMNGTTGVAERRVTSRGKTSDTTESQIIRLANRIRWDVARGKVNVILQLLPPDGMGCGEEKIARARVARDLSQKGTYLHARLFDSATLRERYPESGRTKSLQDTFRRRPRGPIVVTFLDFPGQDPSAFPCANFHSEDDYPETICFFKRDGKWWLTDSFYECE